jgi:hypothetical protein
MGERPHGRIRPGSALILDPAERLHLLVDFAVADLAELEAGRPGDRANLLYDLGRYIGDPDMQDPELHAAQDRPTRLRPAQTAIRALVEAVVDRSTERVVLKAARVTLDASADRPVVYLSAPAGAPLKLKDLLLHIALDDFRTSPVVDRIRRCRREPCARVFFAARSDMGYCDRRCSSRAGVDAYLQRQKVKAEKMRAEGLI